MGKSSFRTELIMNISMFMSGHVYFHTLKCSVFDCCLHKQAKRGNAKSAGWETKGAQVQFLSYSCASAWSEHNKTLTNNFTSLHFFLLVYSDLYGKTWAEIKSGGSLSLQLHLKEVSAFCFNILTVCTDAI